MESVLFGPQVLTIAAGESDYGPAVVPPGTTSVSIKLSRENWPADGVQIELLLSFDGGLSYQSPGPTQIAAFVPTAKQPDPLSSPAIIGRGWNEVNEQATHAKVHVINPASSFQSTVTITSLQV